MMLKVRYIQSIDGGVVFATGTPISNTLVEGYTMQRFLQPEVLKANRLEAFDEWARQYAQSVTQMELNNRHRVRASDPVFKDRERARACY